WRVTVGWMLSFAVVHAYWCLGGGWLLPQGVSGPDSADLFVLTVLSIPLCLAGAAVGWLLRPNQRPGKLRSRAWLLWPATVGADGAAGDGPQRQSGPGPQLRGAASRREAAARRRPARAGADATDDGVLHEDDRQHCQRPGGRQAAAAGRRDPGQPQHPVGPG